MLVLPIRTDCPPRRRPVANIALILLNVAVFVVTHVIYRDIDRIDPYMLNGAEPRLYQFVTYAFLHADWLHLLGNMFFLYIFGNSLNDKLGHAEYVLFYLAGAIFCGAAYALFIPTRMLGASGAIAAVTTGFLVLFPRSRIEVLYVFFFIGTFEVSALVLIGFKMILWDNIIAPSLPSSAPSNIAYTAHLAGYLFGFVVPLALLALRILPRDRFDILALWSRAIRRQQYRQAVHATEKPFAVGLKRARPVRAKVWTVSKDAESDEHTDQINRFRSEIDDALERYDLTTAAELYLKMIELKEDQVLARRQQLDVANQLMADRLYPEAAEAYEKYLRFYPTGEQVAQVKLLLGVIYARHVPKGDRARTLLQEALEKLTDQKQQALCQAELDRLSE